MSFGRIKGDAGSHDQESYIHVSLGGFERNQIISITLHFTTFARPDLDEYL